MKCICPKCDGEMVLVLGIKGLTMDKVLQFPDMMRCKCGYEEKVKQ